jgi:Protein of unknown function DUF262
MTDPLAYQQPATTPYPISDFLDWRAADQLELTPRFQRRSVWEPKARSFLIDTVMRAMPIPPIFMRLRLDSARLQSIREVVDGQQRLRAVLDYFDNGFPVLAVHSEELAGKHYGELSDEQQKRFLRYKFSVTTLEDISDADVLGIFSRLNTYTVPLKAQEHRNSLYFGAFKQTVYELALAHYVFWLKNRIFSDKNIARMLEAEFVSELILTMLDGIRQTKSADLNEAYAHYDENFPQARKIMAEFQAVVDLIGEIFGDWLSLTHFRRRPIFFSVFIALYDARFGLPRSQQSRLSFTNKLIENLSAGFADLEEDLRRPDREPHVEQFLADARYGTADVGRRGARHGFLWQEVLLPASARVRAASRK